MNIAIKCIRQTRSSDSRGEDPRQSQILESQVDKVVEQKEEVLSSQKDMKELLLKILNPANQRILDLVP